MVNNSDTKVSYQGNGQTTVFPFSFPFIQCDYIKVAIYDSLTDETKNLDSDYYVDTVANTVIYPGYEPGQEPAEALRPPILPATSTITIYRQTDVDQLTDLGEKYPLKDIENMADKLTEIIQEQAETLGRAVKVPVGDPKTPEEKLTDLQNYVKAAADSAADAADSEASAQRAAEAAATSKANAAESERLASGYADTASDAASRAEDSAISARAYNAPDYDNETTYQAGEVVTYTDGNSYRALQETTGNEPPNIIYWQKVTDYVGDDFFEVDEYGYIVPMDSPSHSRYWRVDQNGYIVPIEGGDGGYRPDTRQLSAEYLNVTNEGYVKHLRADDVNAGNLSATGNVTAGMLTTPQANVTTLTVNDIVAKGPVVDVRAFGAKGDGVTDDTLAIQAALNVGGNIIFPTGVYKLETPVHSDNENTNIIGLDAVIDCRGVNGGVSGYQSLGSGLLIKGNKTNISGLKFIGYEVEYNSTDYKYGRLLGIDADNVIVENNQFENGNGGAVYVWQHSEISIINNAFNNCNNHPDGYYGAIHITGASDVYIKDNRIKNHWSSGISIMGSNAKNINITNNTIIAKDNLSSDTSMGIYCLNGASKDIYIKSNVIKNATAECIVIHTLTTAQANNIIIENNFLSNANYCAISIQSHDNAIAYNSVIKGNTIYQPGNGHGIRCVNIEDSIISSNYVYTDSTADYVNIGVYVDSTKCIITNNYIKGYQNGVYIYARDNDSIDSNYIHNCEIAIGVTRAANGASVVNNIINECSGKGIVVANSSGVRVANNKVTECTVPGEGFGSSYSQITTGASKTLDYAQGTLSAGSATINFYGIKDNDYLLALPLTGGAGTLRITNKNVTNNQVTVSSSEATDTRQFVVLKIASLFF